MPNTAAAVGRSMTVACANAAVAREQALECTELLEAVGEVMWIKDEGLMDAVTAVSGSGPAYVFLLAECLAEAGPRGRARRRACRPIGASDGRWRRRTAPQLRPQPAKLRENVTSPKGTTAAALEVLMGKGGFEQLLIRAVAAAAKRSRELSS